MVETGELRWFKILEGLDERELESIAKIASTQQRKKGSRITAEKALATSLYLLVEGRVAVKMSGPQGREVLVDEVGPGEVFGWSAATEPHTFTAATWTLEKSRFIVIDGQRLRELFEANNHIGYRVLKGIVTVTTRRLQALRAVLASNAFETVAEDVEPTSG